MPRAPKFPIVVREQSVEVKIYRQQAPSTKAKVAFVVTWVGPNGREKKTFANLANARKDAETRAAQLAEGLSSADLLARSDVFELKEARRLAAEHNLPLLTAMAEWDQARRLVGPGFVSLCEEWSQRRVTSLQRIKVADAVQKFILAKNSAKKRGKRTYESKLKGAVSAFGTFYLDSILASDWSKFLLRYDDAVTRNDIRKRIVTLCRWAKRNSHLPDGAVPEIEKTERTKETANPIGILTPKQYHDLLEHFRANDSKFLAAIVVAGFCGVRADEIQGKRDDRDRRQTWEDIHVDVGEGAEPFLSVTAAKENTPAHRIVHLSEAAVAWLKVCPQPHQGPICEAGAIERARLVARGAGFKLPENCFRHSWITYQIALTGNKAATATEAGNSVAEIDRRYRVPKPRHEGEAWFAIRPRKRRTPPGSSKAKTLPPQSAASPTSPTAPAISQPSCDAATPAQMVGQIESPSG